MDIGSEEEIDQTLLSLCPTPPNESPASAKLNLQESPSSSDEEEIIQEIVKVRNLKSKEIKYYSCDFKNDSRLNPRKGWPTKQVLIEAQKN